MYLDNYLMGAIIIALSGSMLVIGLLIKESIALHKEIHRLQIALRSARIKNR